MPPIRGQSPPPMPGLATNSVPEEKPIPRPRNAWIFFRTDRMKILLEDPRYARLSQGEFSSKLAGMWRELSPVERAYWEDLAKKEAARHKEMYPTYKYQPKKKEEKQRLAAAKKIAQAAERQRVAAERQAARRSTSRSISSTTTFVAQPVAVVPYARPSPYYIPDMRARHYTAEPPAGDVDDRAPTPLLPISSDNVLPSPSTSSPPHPPALLDMPLSSTDFGLMVPSLPQQPEASTSNLAGNWNEQVYPPVQAVEGNNASNWNSTYNPSDLTLNLDLESQDINGFNNWASLYGDSYAGQLQQLVHGNGLEIYQIPDFDPAPTSISELAVSMGQFLPVDEPPFLSPDFNAPDYSNAVFGLYDTPQSSNNPYANGFDFNDFVNFPLAIGADFFSPPSPSSPALQPVENSVSSGSSVEPYVPPSGAGNSNRRVGASFRKDSLPILDSLPALPA